MTASPNASSRLIARAPNWCTAKLKFRIPNVLTVFERPFPDIDISRSLNNFFSMHLLTKPIIFKEIGAKCPQDIDTN
jgi:hypothetical protein